MNSIRNVCCLIFLVFFTTQVPGQNQDKNPFRAQPLTEALSLHEYALYANAGQEIYTLEEVRANTTELDFRPLDSENVNIGFTKDQYWVKFRITNATSQNHTYFLETARPITDEIDFYSISTTGKLQFQQSGDKMAFSDRSFNHRKTIFEIHLPSEETLDIYLRYESDGEVLNLPLLLHDAFSLLRITYIEQLDFGIFFGILLIAAIIYLFFFFALGERSFLYYSIYVVTVGLLQLSLDGYFFSVFWTRRRLVIQSCRFAVCHNFCRISG